MRKQRELFRVHGPTGKAPKGGGIPPVPPFFLEGAVTGRHYQGKRNTIGMFSKYKKNNSSLIGKQHIKMLPSLALKE